MTVNELIGKLNALPEEQRECEVRFYEDYDGVHNAQGEVCKDDILDMVLIYEY